MELHESLKFKPDKSIHVSEIQIQLIIAEHEKVVEEIQHRTEDDVTWFYYKFLLVGALAGAILFYGYFYRDSNKKELEFTDILSKKFFPLTVSLCFIICVVIDIHVKQNLLVTQQLGSWVAYQYEPIIRYYKDKPSDQNDLKDFLGWEDFLRQESKDDSVKIPASSLSYISQYCDVDTVDVCLNNMRSIFKSLQKHIQYPVKLTELESKDFRTRREINSLIKDQREKIMSDYRVFNSPHTNLFYSLAHFPAFHILTWMLYVLFLYSTFFYLNKYLYPGSENESTASPYQILVTFNFIMISSNITIFLFAVLSRAQSDIFKMHYLIWNDRLTTPVRSGLFNLIIAGLIALINLGTYFVFYRRRIKESI